LATVYTLLEPADLAQKGPPPHGGYRGSGPFCADADLWRKAGGKRRQRAIPGASGGGLGKGAFQVWQMLRIRGRLSAAELAEATGRDKRTVMRSLGAMAEQGMVEAVADDQWAAVADVDLAAVAAALGVAGAGLRQQAEHEAERRLHRQGLTR